MRLSGVSHLGIDEMSESEEESEEEKPNEEETKEEEEEDEGKKTPVHMEKKKKKGVVDVPHQRKEPNKSTHFTYVRCLYVCVCVCTPIP